MPDAKQVVESTFMEMRWRALSLAADMDRIERAEGGAGVIGADPRLKNLREALRVVAEGRGNRAEQVQMIFSDMSPAPAR
jgi:hypothetical protein